MAIWEGETVVISGGTSFVGASIADTLVHRGADVHLLVRRQSQTARLPRMVARMAVHRCSDAEAAGNVVHSLPVALLIHCASMFKAEHVTEDIEPMVQANVAYGTILLDALRSSRAPRFLNIGTAWQHFRGNAYDPACLYAATKQAFECMVEYYVRAYSYQVVTVELPDTYGASDFRGKLLSALVRAAKTGVPLALSPGEQKLDLLHIEDVVSGLLAASVRLRGGNPIGHERYALSSGQAISLQALVEIVGRVLGADVPVKWGARPYRFREVMEPNTGGVRPDGWAPNVSLEEGIRSVVDDISIPSRFEGTP